MPEVICLDCSIKFQKRMSQVGKSPNHFCTRRCAAGYNNRLYPRRQQEGQCKTCGIQITSSRTYCRACWEKQGIDWSGVTLGEIRSATKYQAHAVVRALARSVYKKSGLPQRCANCGYAKTYDVAHKKAIGAHEDLTPVTAINQIENLIALCPNCHWEFDHGILAL